MTFTLDRRALLASGSALAFSLANPVRARAAAPTTPQPSIETYATPKIRSVTLSPDGKRVAGITQTGDDNILVALTIGEPKPKAFAIPVKKVRDLFWGDNSHIIMVDSATVTVPEFVKARAEVLQARSIDIDNTKFVTFFDYAQKPSTTGTLMTSQSRYYPIVMGSLHRIKVDGKYRVTASNYNMQGEYSLDLFSFDPNSERGERLLAGTNTTDNFVVTPDGRVAAFTTYDDFRKEFVLAYNMDLASGGKNFRTIYRHKGDGLSAPGASGLGRDGNSIVIYIYPDDGKTPEYHEVSADGVLGPVLHPEDKTGEHFPLFHPTTGRLVGFGRYDESFHPDYFDPLLKKLYDALPKMVGDGYRYEVADYAEDPRQMIVKTEGPDDAGTYYHIDFTTGQAQPVAAVYPDLPEEWISNKTAIDYKAADGLNIHAYLTLPPFKAANNLPLIVLPHGGPEARDYIDFDWQSQALASRGYAVLQPNFRGSSGYGDSFTQAGYGEWGRKMQTDLSDGVRHLVAKGVVDPKRVAILGASYGGYAAMAGPTLDPGVYTCAVAIAGVSDLKAMLDWETANNGVIDSTTVRYWKRFMGDPAHYSDISPARQAAKASCPILLIHGTDDTVVPIDQSRRMESALKTAGKPVEFITYKGQDHWETIGSARIEMMKAAIAFLEKHNPPA
ncbi:S9 family peptidase [Asticcacaulis sp. 201]|uniref:alpha/beta hydrolase family protein n=1 Tax=Asticcacaulis sp. 201 TaxID=3028787 RepID=UPI00291633B7|nr:S9 family peptidase [Asticcacaulis sp. 201]MDV6332556.1 S9 family peptidase [Asticcacaulis sp. 201]